MEWVLVPDSEWSSVESVNFYKCELDLFKCVIAEMCFWFVRWSSFEHERYETVQSSRIHENRRPASPSRDRERHQAPKRDGRSGLPKVRGSRQHGGSKRRQEKLHQRPAEFPFPVLRHGLFTDAWAPSSKTQPCSIKTEDEQRPGAEGPEPIPEFYRLVSADHG